MTLPIIGLTTFRTKSSSDLPQFTATEAYVSALARAGASPVLIPLGLSESALSKIISRLDGILLTGGGDVHPHCYASEMHPLVDDIDVDRDRTELHLVEKAIQSEKPFMGICRGLQLINVALGGTLYEDILEQHQDAAPHQFWPEKPRGYLAHEVDVLASSRLSSILEHDTVRVNSMHHQGIRRLAPNLHATAYSPDGIIEAIELIDHPFGLAVQWHPEWLPDDPGMQRLFSSFINAGDKMFTAHLSL